MYTYMLLYAVRFVYFHLLSILKFPFKQDLCIILKYVKYLYGLKAKTV